MNLLKNVSDQTLKGRLLQGAATAIFPWTTFIFGVATAAGDTFTFGSNVYEWYANAGDPTSVTAGNIPVELPATVNASTVQAPLEAAIQAQKDAGNQPEFNFVSDVNVVYGDLAHWVIVGTPGSNGTTVDTDMTGATGGGDLANEREVDLSGDSRTVSFYMPASPLATFYIPTSFRVAGVSVKVINEGADTGWDGDVYYGSPTAGDGRPTADQGDLIALDDANATNFAQDDCVIVTLTKLSIYDEEP